MYLALCQPQKCASKAVQVPGQVPALLRHGTERRGRSAVIREADVSCPFPTPHQANPGAEAEETRYSFSAVPTSNLSGK